jgi:hypothetical protein
VGRLGDEGPADEIFETLLRHRPPSISHDTAAFHAKQRLPPQSASRLLSRERSTVWQAVKLRDGKATWWRNFGSEAEALEAAGLRE